MDTFLQFFSVPVVVFCLFLFGIIFVQRKIIEHFLPQLKDKTYKFYSLWRDVVLPVEPIIVGTALGHVLTFYPFPEIFQDSTSRAMVGFVCGLVCNVVYKIVKKNLTQRFLKSDPS